MAHARGEIVFTPEKTENQVTYISDESFELDLDNIFDEFDDIFKALVEKWQSI